MLTGIVGPRRAHHPNSTSFEAQDHREETFDPWNAISVKIHNHIGKFILLILYSFKIN